MTSVQQASADLERRYTCRSGYYYNNGYCSRSKWYWIGRWILLGIILFFFFVILFLICIRNRRRRRQGQTPMYGTGWIGNFGGGNPQQYPPPPPQYNQAPPQYAQYTGGTYDSNQGYYGNRSPNNNDIPLQPPAGAYYPSNANNGAEEYAPPTGPPPGKK